MARWPACVAKNIANSSSAPVKGIKTTAYKEDTTNVLKSFLHVCTPFPPYHHIYSGTCPDRTRLNGVQGPSSEIEPSAGTPPVMAVGWIPCLESKAPGSMGEINSEIGEKTRHSPSSGEGATWRSESFRLALSYTKAVLPRRLVPQQPLLHLFLPGGGEGSCSIPSVPHTTTSSCRQAVHTLSFAFSLPFKDPNLYTCWSTLTKILSCGAVFRMNHYQPRS